MIKNRRVRLLLPMFELSAFVFELSVLTHLSENLSMLYSLVQFALLPASACVAPSSPVQVCSHLTCQVCSQVRIRLRSQVRNLLHSHPRTHLHSYPNSHLRACRYLCIDLHSHLHSHVHRTGFISWLSRTLQDTIQLDQGHTTCYLFFFFTIFRTLLPCMQPAV